MDFLDRLRAAQAKNHSLLCVGLDPDFDKLPERFSQSPAPLADFNCEIIDVTADLVCAFKPNSAFYESRGATGMEELKRTCDYLHEKQPELPIILDFKRGDIGSTNEHYAKFAFEYLGVDAVTLHPYQGREAVQPFLDYKDKGIIILCRMSNPGANEFQNLPAGDRPLYQQVAENVAKDWNANGNCLLVVGATAPQELAEVRRLVGADMFLLVPGIGAQGGDIEATLLAGGQNLIINSSRAIIYADDPRQAATATRDAINQYRRK